MKILYKKAKETDSKTTYSVTFADNVLTVGFEINRHGETFKSSQVFDITTIAGRIMEIAVIETDVPNAVISFPVFENNSWGNKHPSKTLSKGDVRIARVAVDENGKDWVVQLARPTEEVAGFDNFKKPEGITEVAFFMQHSETVKERVERSKRKSALFNNVDTSDSIAYLEAQIDALTRYILSEKQDINALTVLQEAEKRSVMDSKPLHKLLQEFEHKANVREQQAQYYEAVKSIES